MRSLGSMLLFAAVVLFYLVEVDRQSALALHAVELDGKLRFIKGYSIAGLLGLMLWTPTILGRIFAKQEGPTITTAGHRPAQNRVARRPLGQDAMTAPLDYDTDNYGLGTQDMVGHRTWRESILAQVRRYDGGMGARLLVDQSMGVPLTLVLEHMSPRHCDRAVGELALMLQTVPLPPRIRVVFDQCPEGPAPRHHLVSRALGAVIAPGSFKATASADQVEVLFLAPDPRWRTEW